MKEEEKSHWLVGCSYVQLVAWAGNDVSCKYDLLHSVQVLPKRLISWEDQRYSLSSGLIGRSPARVSRVKMNSQVA